jgi:hypothetical protein
MAADAKLVEDAFEGRLSELAASEAAAPAAEQSLPADAGPVVDTPVAQRVVPDGGAAIGAGKGSESDSLTRVDKSVLAIAAPRRYRKASAHYHQTAVPERGWWKAAGIAPLTVARKLWKGRRVNEGRLPDRSDLVLIVAWLLAAFRFGGPYPLLAISGEQGSAKTVLSKLLKALVDPNTAPVRALAREERELMIAANNGHLLAFDNLSGLPPWVSDGLCRLASGGSFAGCASFTLMTRRYCFKPRARSFSTASRMSSAGPILLIGRFFLRCPPIGDAQRRSDVEL